MSNEAKINGVILHGKNHPSCTQNRAVPKEVDRHLRCLVWDRNIRDVFDDSTVIPFLQYILNTHVSSETGFSPFELTFGSPDKIYGDLLNCSCIGYHDQYLREVTSANDSTKYDWGFTVVET
jgi:hypothetical protein